MTVRLHRNTQPEQAIEPHIVAVAPLVAQPPDVAEVAPTDAISAVPRFRPRAATMARRRREGDPALAVWNYLCNRDETLVEAVQRVCPAEPFGEVVVGARGPLIDNGDIGALLSADRTTMSLEEAAVARGWIKMPPPKGQTGLVNRTDKSHSDPASDRLGPLPWDVGASKGATPSWTKDRPEVVPNYE